jgi:hypothetical protein
MAQSDMAQSDNVVDKLEIINKGTTPEEIQAEIEKIIAELKKKDLAQLKAIQENDYSAMQDHGVGVLEVVIIGFLGALAKEAGKTVWQEIIWPSLEFRLKGKIKKKS